MRRHVDGAPCPCQPGCGPACLCVGTGGLPMYRDPRLNPDGLALDADHSTPRAFGGTHADRLLFATCNRSRGDGTRATMTRALVTSRDW